MSVEQRDYHVTTGKLNELGALHQRGIAIQQEYLGAVGGAFTTDIGAPARRVFGRSGRGRRRRGRNGPAFTRARFRVICSLLSVEGGSLPISIDPRIGDELLGYRIEALIGRGGMGVVYRAYDARLKRDVALKLIAPELAADVRWRERFLTESELAAALEHPNVVPIHDAGEVDGQLALAMRYISGSDLKTVLAQEQVLEPKRALAICAQLAGALDAAHHRGLVHRDVKPSNVLLDEQDHCYLADFGLTRRLADEAPGLAANASLGTPAYAAPEDIGGGELDGRADQYSLACLLFECLTGQPPFDKDTAWATLFAHLEEPPPSAAKLQPKLPEQIDPVFARSLAKEPLERYATCSDLVQAARLAFEAGRRSRRRLVVATFVVAVAAALAVILPLAITDGDARPSSKPTLAIKSDSLQRIDLETNKLVATIRLPGRLQGSQSVAAGGGSLWVTNFEKNAISQIDPKRNAVGRTLGASGEASVLAYGAGSLWALNERDGIVSRIDPASGVITESVPLPPGSAASGLGAAVGAGGGSWLKANAGAVWLSWLTPTTNVVRIDPRTMAVRPTQIGPASVGLLRDLVQVGSTLWSIGSRGGAYRSALYRTGLQTGGADLLAAPLRGDACCTLAVDRKSVYVAHSDRHLVLRLDWKGRVRAQILVRGRPFSVTLSAGSLWVSNAEGTLSRINPDTGKVVAIVPVGGAPQGPPVPANGGIWVAVRARSDAQ